MEERPDAPVICRLDGEANPPGSEFCVLGHPLVAADLPPRRSAAAPNPAEPAGEVLTRWSVTFPDGSALVLSPDQPLRLGRTEPGSIGTALGAYRNVSRLHAELRLTASGLVVTDLGSANGTYLDGRRLPAGEPTPIEAGQRLRLAADHELLLERVA